MTKLGQSDAIFIGSECVRTFAKSEIMFLLEILAGLYSCSVWTGYNCKLFICESICTDADLIRCLHCCVNIC